MDSLFYFLAGVLFVVFAMPIVQSISDLFITLCDVYKAKMGVQITSYNYEISKINAEISPSSAIGFSIPDDDCEEDFYDNDDDDDFECGDSADGRLKIKMGFDGGCVK